MLVKGFSKRQKNSVMICAFLGIKTETTRNFAVQKIAEMEI